MPFPVTVEPVQCRQSATAVIPVVCAPFHFKILLVRLIPVLHPFLVRHFERRAVLMKMDDPAHPRVVDNILVVHDPLQHVRYPSFRIVPVRVCVVEGGQQVPNLVLAHKRAVAWVLALLLVKHQVVAHHFIQPQLLPCVVVYVVTYKKRIALKSKMGQDARELFSVISPRTASRAKSARPALPQGFFPRSSALIAAGSAAPPC